MEAFSTYIAIKKRWADLGFHNSIEQLEKSIQVAANGEEGLRKVLQFLTKLKQEKPVIYNSISDLAERLIKVYKEVFGIVYQI